MPLTERRLPAELFLTMSKLLVQSIRFTKDGTGNRMLNVVLTSGMHVEIKKVNGNKIQYRFLSLAHPTKTERLVCNLVYDACWNYLNGDEPESMDSWACFHAYKLANERFDWESAGYPATYEKGERELCLSSKIAHYENI